MFRKDIQGLRAIAVIVVLLFHFWPHRLPGGYVGVDVFFVISGFLITLHLLKKPPVTWKALVDFWARRIKRLIPAATVVLAATLVASLLWLPETMIQRVLHEVVTSAVYVQNWALAATATDYLAATEAPSPVQHYWSLSIEEQYYAIWPVIIGGIFLLGRRFFTSNKLLAAGMATIFIASLAYSIYLTQADPAAAYFVTPTRVWELTIGGIIALLATRATVPARLAVLMAWGGLAMIAAAVLLFTKETPFPGYTALLPTIGTALVIMAATDGMKWSPRRLLGLKPMQFMGDISYSVYLWHWPVLIIAPFAFGVTKMPLILSISLIANIIVLAYLTKIYIEDPVRRSKRLAGTNTKTYAYGLASIAVVIGLTFVSQGHPKVQSFMQHEAMIEQLDVALRSNPCVGAGSMRNDDCQGEFEDNELLMTPAFASKDKSMLYQDKCWSVRPKFKQDIVCSYGKVGSRVKVALLGNSHAGMWHATLEKIAVDNEWQLDTYLASICYTMDRPMEVPGDGATENCQKWNKWAIEQVGHSDYDVVIISNYSYAKLLDVPEMEMDEERHRGYAETIDKLLASGKRIFVIRDAPTGSKPDCLAVNDNYGTKCDLEREAALTVDPLYEAALSYDTQKVGALDLSHRFCDEEVCHTVIGGLVVRYDTNHLTNTYVKTLTPDIAPPLVEFVNGKS